MSDEFLAFVAVSAFLLAYLLAAMLAPERF